MGESSINVQSGLWCVQSKVGFKDKVDLSFELAIDDGGVKQGTRAIWISR